MNIAQAALCLTAPDEFLAGIDLKGIAAQAPPSEFETDIVDDSLSLELIGDPGGRETTVVFPLGEFIIVKAARGVFAVVASSGGNDVDTASQLLIRGGEGRLATKE